MIRVLFPRKWRAANPNKANKCLRSCCRCLIPDVKPKNENMGKPNGSIVLLFVDLWTVKQMKSCHLRRSIRPCWICPVSLIRLGNDEGNTLKSLTARHTDMDCVTEKQFKTFKNTNCPSSWAIQVQFEKSNYFGRNLSSNIREQPIQLYQVRCDIRIRWYTCSS